MESERGRSRASSTSSLGREVRCGCQFFQSDLLLPERSAMIMSRPGSPTSRNINPVIKNTCDHEYEPVGGGLLMTRTLTTADTAPVVRIIDTDIGPVADSDDDGIDIRGRYTPGPILEGDELVLPLDGQIEDRAMDSRELGSGDTSDEIETAQQLQDRIEERFLNSVTPCTESRTDAEINTSQVDSSVMEELPLRRGARGLPNRLRLQADKLRTRLKSIQRPNFNFPIERNKTRKSRSSERTKKTTDKLRNSQKNKKIKKNDKLKTTDTTNIQNNNNNNINNEKQSRIQKLRSSIQEHSKFSFPDKSKFHLPERPKINLPNFTKFTNKTNFHMPTLKRHTTTTTTTTSSSQALPSSNETTAGSRKSIFDFSTVPRFFDKKTKQQQQQHDYTTSSPKDSCADPTESATFPRTKKTKSFSARWTQKFTDLKFTNNDEIKLANEHEKPWIHGSQEKPRLSLRPQESLDDSEQLPWEASDGRRPSQQHEENSYEDDIVEVDNQERMIKQKFKKILRQQSSESYDNDIPQIDPRIYGDQAVRRFDSEETDENNKTNDADDEFRVSFEPVDPRRLKKCISSEEDEEIVNENLHDNLSSEVEDESMRSDREQQASSGSSCDRRRRGVIETIDSDEFFLRAKGISEDEDMHNGEYLNTEIKNALRKPVTAQEVIILDVVPPERPVRMRSFRKRKESYESSEGNNSLSCTKRILRRSEESDFGSNIIQNDDSYSGSRHRIVYHTESVPLNLPNEPLDDLIVIKPIRRKSKLSLRSTSQVPIEIIQEIPSSNLQQQEQQQQQQQPPPIIPRRKKHQEIKNTQQQKNVNDNKENIEKEIFGNYTKTEIPIKPARCSSRETINLKNNNNNNKINDDNNECVAPIAPSRRSRSRGTSIAQDDDRTSRGAESMSDIAYADDDVDDDDDNLNDGDDDEADNKIKIDYPGYALIDKKEKKPPRPPPPQRHKDKFSTAPRLSKHTPSRPERGYSTLKTRTPTPINRALNTRGVSMSYLDSDDMDDNEQKNLLSGEVLFKMSKRPLPAPPRPPRSRRSINKINNDDDDDDDNNTESIDDNTDDILHDEYAHLSTQTDPLPDDLMIEEVTQARLIMTPSEDGSQIFISTERIPSPLSSTTSKIINKNLKKRKKINSRLSTNSESDIRQSRINFDNYNTPNVPPLPFYTDDDDNNTPQRPPRTRSHSLSIPKDSSNNNNNNNETRAAIIEALEERLSALLANETLRIGSLEVGDLRCDKLNVSQLEAHKIVASEIDAIVITATELTNSGETSNNNNNNNILNPTVLNELIAIKSQLEQFVLQNHHETTTNPISETSTNIIEEVEEKIINKDETKSDKLQLDLLSRSTETRAIYSTHGIQSHQSHHHHLQQQQHPVITEAPTKIEENREKSISRSRSNSPSKTTLRLRQTASPVRSLPPVISVTPDSPDNICQKLETSESKAQRAKISYTNDTSPNTTRPSSPQSRSSTPQTRPLSTPPPPTTATTIFELPTNNQSSQQQQQQFITFQNSQIPPQFYTLASPNQLNNSKDIQEEPSIICMTQQLLRALQLLGMRAIRHLVHYVTTRLRLDETEAKIREVELAFCALLLIIAGLLIVCFAGPRTITHHHHWDYFNPPRL